MIESFFLKSHRPFYKMRLIPEKPQEIENIYLADSPDCLLAKIRFEAHKSCLANNDRMNELVNKGLPHFDPHYRDICVAGARKEWVYNLSNLLIQINLAKVFAKRYSIATEKIFVISNYASLLGFFNVDPDLFDKVQCISQSFKNKALLRLFGPVFLCLVESV